MVTYRSSIWRLLQWQWRRALAFSGAAALIVVAHDYLFIELSLPSLPLAVVGAAIGIFVSFRTNSCYDRWWEGRKLWGRLINTSRHFANQVLSYVPSQGGGTSEADEIRAVRTALVRRHIAYVHTLRCVLRTQDPFADPDVVKYLTTDETQELAGLSNVNQAMLLRQSRQLTALADAGQLDALRLQSFDESLRALLDIQGGCERIKKTPFPRGYQFIADRLVLYFAFLFPLALVEELGWFTVPINLLVTLSFALISEAGRVLEDPFTVFYNGLALHSMSKTIERNLLEALGEKELPEIPGPDARGILM